MVNHSSFSFLKYENFTSISVKDFDNKFKSFRHAVIQETKQRKDAFVLPLHRQAFHISDHNPLCSLDIHFVRLTKADIRLII
jgi:hypothetical protein